MVQYNFSLKNSCRHDDRVICCAYGPNHEIVTASLDHTVKFWNKELTPLPTAHNYPVSAVALHGSIAASCDRGGNMMIWQDGKSVNTIHAHEVFLHIAENAQSL